MKPVFVIGSGRCGSSLLHELICRHADVAFISNLDDRLASRHLSGRFNGTLYRNIPQALTAKGRLRFAPSEAFNIISRYVSPIYADSCRDLRQTDVTPWLALRMQELFVRHQQAQGTSHFVHKFTGWPRIDFFDEIFPESRFIHVVRDGRAVANSWLQMPWWNGYRGPEQWHWGPLPEQYEVEWLQGEKDFVMLAGILWKMLMDRFDAAAQRLDAERLLTIRYEDFLRQPREEMERMITFIGLEWNSDFDRHFSRWKIHPEREAAWKHDMDSSQATLLNNSLADHLQRYGYV